ncbi:monofunctional biosynthetic peptidoglycan transglycosylase [Natronohydrobacter thiooxidans]|uniref:monofunctional biosynthetic peptidoglycan transglycosylase n=1 Tax=Natronohydrobacter thiooxidans TaxID=87172 RepID=UPI0008FF61D5|nr:monofunctional biosynthetic peptidoglycan transglycosylase [Natronohydrobacter thiooxidans]
MARASSKKRTSAKEKRKPHLFARLAAGLDWIWRSALRILALVFLLAVAWVGLYRFVPPPGGIYMLQEYRRIGEIQREWVPMERIAPVMARSVIAAEDANFCLHWGFDMTEIRRVIEQGSSRGASTLTQQTAKNAFLWHGRNFMRKGLESGFTLLIEGLWPKRRILEVYLNLAEFDDGVFGVEAAARHYFRSSAADLTPVQAARLAAVLPAPKSRNAANPTQFVRNRAASIMDGAATIARDGRAACIGG